MKNTIAAIIPTYRRDQYLVNTIKDLLSQTRVPDEIIVLDQTRPNEHAPETTEFLNHHHSDGSLRLVTLVRPGVYPARNKAVELSRSDILLYLDDDITAVKDLVVNHLRHYQNEAIAAVVGSVVCDVNEDMTPPHEKFRQACKVERYPVVKKDLSATGVLMKGVERPPMTTH